MQWDSFPPSSPPRPGLILPGEAKGRLCVIQMLQEAVEVFPFEGGEGVVYVVFPIQRLVRDDGVIACSLNSKYSM